jgi:hypothetical protein
MTTLLPEIFAGGFDRYDGTIQFYQRVNALLRPDFVVVGFGAGRGRIHVDDPIAYRRGLTSLKGKVKEVIGVDVDSAVTTNPAIDRAIVISGSEFPLPDRSVDLILSDFTFEHLGDPDRAKLRARTEAGRLDLRAYPKPLWLYCACQQLLAGCAAIPRAAWRPTRAQG